MRYADQVGTEYIENKLSRINDYILVGDYLALGDALLEKGDYEGAGQKYMLAKNTALSVHDAEGKKKLYEEKSGAESQAKAESAAREKLDAVEEKQAKQEEQKNSAAAYERKKEEQQKLKAYEITMAQRIKMVTFKM